jgi:hypothetical protein
MALVGVLTPLRACLLAFVQILGGMTVSGPSDHLNVSNVPVNMLFHALHI